MNELDFLSFCFDINVADKDIVIKLQKNKAFWTVAGEQWFAAICNCVCM